MAVQPDVLVARLEELTAAFARQAEELRSLQLVQRIGLNETLTKEEAAKELGVSRNATLKRLIDQGSLTLVQFGRHPRIPRKDVERLKRDGFVLEASRERKEKKTARTKTVRAATGPVTLDTWRFPGR